MSTTDTGKNAEDCAADYLRQQGFTIVAQNWRTWWCEIDIIATKKKNVYFVEVKYRHSVKWGDGLDAITPKKQQQMAFAAEMWVQTNNWQGDYCLAAVSLNGLPPVVQEYIEL